MCVSRSRSAGADCAEQCWTMQQTRQGRAASSRPVESGGGAAGNKHNKQRYGCKGQHVGLRNGDDYNYLPAAP